jgi:anti-anti-sigma factor
VADLTIDIENAAGGFRVFRLTGPLTLDNIFDFQDEARADTSVSIIIDLSGVPYMDSAGLGALLGIMASCQRTGRGFGITGASERVRTIFQVSRVEALIPTFESVETAERLLARAASA